ncbi:MAG: GNAT family N-acetyltransferase [Acidobacteria bacterium]|nr:GNAT family N-acetyltransferase [Acidobacteriota bacterium]
MEETTRTFIEAWKLMVGRLPSGRISHSDGVVSCIGHVPLPFFNVGFHDAPLAALDDVRRYLAVFEDRAAECPYPTMLVVREDWVPGEWTSVAAEAGRAHVMYVTGMETDELLPPRRPLPALEFRRVNNTSTAGDMASINAKAYGIPEQWFDCVGQLDIWAPDTHGYVGYVDGQAVTSAATFPAGGTLYAALVATLPDCHGKGYAEAVMRHAIAEGRRATGLTRTTLHASDMGLPLYENMGFQSSSRFSLLAKTEAH